MSFMGMPPTPDPMQGDLFTEGPIAPPFSMDRGAPPGEKHVDREPPEPDEKRSALVTAWRGKVKSAKSHWEPDFKRMREDMNFAYGLQWSKNADDDRYKANVVLRAVQQMTAFLYAKNPKAVARRRPKILNTVWDGTQQQLDAIMQSGAMMMQSGAQLGGPPPMAGGGGALGAPPMGGSPPVPGMNGMEPPMGGPPGMEMPGGPSSIQMPGMPPAPAAPMMAGMQQAMAVMEDAGKVRTQLQQLDKIAKTLEILYDYQVTEQSHSFKQMMKMLVRRTVTVGVGYVKLGFQRVMSKRPEIEAKLSDMSQRLSTLERLSADLADNEFDETQAECEQLRLLTADLQSQSEFIVREGLTFDYPGSMDIIPDPKTIHLKGFLGSDWVAQEFILLPTEVQEIYGKDVGDKFTAYSRPDGKDVATRAQEIMSGNESRSEHGDDKERSACCVWEIYSRKDGLVYVVCDGYPDFLREPASPEIELERFYPWFTLCFNECEHEDHIYPPSHVRLMKDMQMEYNRSRQGLREHRIAARPKTLVSAGVLDEEDIEKLASHPNNAVLELNGLQPGQKVQDLLQPWAGPGIDPNLYEINPIWEDLQRVTGLQEANMGGNSKGTATESQISEASRSTSMGSNIDDLDCLLSDLARSGGQILLKEVHVETVKQIVGEGAVWPEMTRTQISQELWLEVEAGSTGRPNQAQEIANAERIFPLLFQIPKIDPEFLGKELLKRLDDRLDLEQAFKSMLPSIVAMNAMRNPVAPGAGAGPGASQGPAGVSNQPGAPGEAGSPAPDQGQMLAGSPPPNGPMQ